MSSLQPEGALLVIATGKLRDVVVSPNGATAYVSDADGWVTAYDVSTGAFRGLWKVGVQLGGMDVSVDGRYLVATEMHIPDNNSLDPIDLTIHRLDLVTGVVKDFTTKSARGEGPLYDVAMLPDGKALISQTRGTGWLPLLTLDFTTGALAKATGIIYQNPILSRSADHTKIVVSTPGISSQDIYLYKFENGSFFSHNSHQDYVSGYGGGLQAISPDGNIIIQYANVYDGNLKYKLSVTNYQSERFSFDAFAFSADGSRVYILNMERVEILELSTSNWEILRILPAGIAADASLSAGAFGDTLTLSADGRHLIILSATRALSIDLATVVPDGGSDRADVIVGGAGADTLYGYAGDDVITGGAGNDKIYGGAGNDQIIGGDGNDSVDGGSGVDTLSYVSSAVAVSADLARNYVQSLPYAWTNTIAGVENLVGSQFGDTLLGDSKANVLDGGEGNDTLRGAGGGDTLIGGGGDDILVGEEGDDVLDGGAGADIASYEGAVAGVTVDLTKFGVLQNTRGGGLDSLVNIEGLKGSAYDDTLTGAGGPNVIDGGGGRDVIFAGEGSDQLTGGAGFDVAFYSGASKDFTWTREIDGSWTVRTSGSEGVDKLTGIEVVRFADKALALEPSAGASVYIAALGLLRGGEAVQVAGWIADMVRGAVTQAQALEQVMRAGDRTTSVATLSYQFFTGKIPSEAGVDYLVSPTSTNGNNLNSAYYQMFSMENRYINFAVNLGKVGEGQFSFASKYGSLSLFDATRAAYKTIFGAAPTDDKIHALIDDRTSYFAAYGGDGPNGIGTKAAMVGWLLAEAEKADLGVMARSNHAWMNDLAADGSAPFAINILDPAKGYYQADFIFGGG